MENRLTLTSKNYAVSSLSLPTSDNRGHYHSLTHNDMIDILSTSNDYNTQGTSVGAAITTTTATNTPMASSNLPIGLCRLINGRQVQQRYKLLLHGSVQVCRVPHAKNIIEKIRFSRFLRRWEDHYLNLDCNQISSTNVSIMNSIDIELVNVLICC
jgi:hypothetical protein